MSPSVELAGRWLVGGVFAEGGMAYVHIGCDRHDPRRRVAIKRLHPQFAHNPDFITMFGDEVRITARIRHPKVVSTLDVVRGESELFLVLEYVEGVTLAELRSLQGGALPVGPLATIVQDVLEGLHAAHESTDELGRKLGVVHRDVSPQNVIVGVDGMARVLDFGIAKAMGRFYETRGGQKKGKIAYFAPEQLRGDPVDRRTDVYTAAVLLWEFLADRRLFKGRNQAETLENIRSLQVPKPSEVTGRVDEDERSLVAALDDVVLRGLAREPADRYPDAAAFAEALAAVVPADRAAVQSWVATIGASALAERSRTIEHLLSPEILQGNLPQEQEPVSLRRGDGPHPIRALVAASSEGGASDEDAALRESATSMLPPPADAEAAAGDGAAAADASEADKSASWWQKAVRGVRRPGSGWFWVIILLPSLSTTTWLVQRQPASSSLTRTDEAAPPRACPPPSVPGRAAEPATTPFGAWAPGCGGLGPCAQGNLMQPEVGSDKLATLGGDRRPGGALVDASAKGGRDDEGHLAHAPRRLPQAPRGLPRHEAPKTHRGEAAPRAPHRPGPLPEKAPSAGAGAKGFRPQLAPW